MAPIGGRRRQRTGAIQLGLAWVSGQALQEEENNGFVGVTRAKDFSAAEYWFRLAAASGFAPAQYRLGLLYWEGFGAFRSAREAARNFRLAADQGHARAQYSLAVLYKDGEGVMPDDVQAYMWWNLVTVAPLSTDSIRDAAEHSIENIGKRMEPVQRAEANRLAREWTHDHGIEGTESRDMDLTSNAVIKTNVEAAGRAQSGVLPNLKSSAEQGQAEAQFVLGSMYAAGTIVDRNHIEAVQWLRLSAEQGYAQSFFPLLNAYLEGNGVPQDYVSAHLWFNIAAARLTGDDRAVAVEQRDLVQGLVNSNQVAEAQRLAREWNGASQR